MAARQRSGGRGQQVVAAPPLCCSSRRGLLLLAVAAAALAASGSLPLAEAGAWSNNGIQQNDNCPAAAAIGRAPHATWGCNGELWQAAGPLADWTYAGYGAGFLPMPTTQPVKADVRSFGAKGDGWTDDTGAVLAALQATAEGGGVVYFPPGRYALYGQLFLRTNQVLRGAGRDSTVLDFKKPLADVLGWGSTGYEPGKSNSPYTWANALITNARDVPPVLKDPGFLGKVTAPARRGDTRVAMQLDPAAFGAGKAVADVLQPGDFVALRMYETKAGDLAKSLTNKRTDVGTQIGPTFGGRMMFTHNSRVLSAGQDYVELERPLTVDVEQGFGPLMYRSAQFLASGVGVEDLEICFPWTEYLGHHEERGFNAIELTSAVNSWVRRVRIVNADSAIRLYSSMFNTVEDVEVTTFPRPRAGGQWTGKRSGVRAEKDGHMAIALHWASFDNLIRNFNINATFYHELLVAGYSARNVFADGRGLDLTLDHHGAAPHDNLWTNIDVGRGTSVFDWSGDPEHFPFGGANNVFWNVYASRPAALPKERLDAARMASSYSAKLLLRSQRFTNSGEFANRPAYLQGYGQVVVDTPIDQSARYVGEAGDWLISYDPYRPIWPVNLWSAQRTTMFQRLRVARVPPRKPLDLQLMGPLRSLRRRMGL